MGKDVWNYYQKALDSAISDIKEYYPWEQYNIAIDELPESERFIFDQAKKLAEKDPERFAEHLTSGILEVVTNGCRAEGLLQEVRDIIKQKKSGGC